MVNTIVYTKQLYSNFPNKYINMMQVTPNNQSNRNSNPNQISLMQANLLQLQREITQRSNQDEQQLSTSHLRKRSSIHPQQQSFERSQRSIHSIIKQHYEEYLHRSSLPQNHQQKINQLIQEQITIGNAVALFQMVYYFKQALTQEILQQISNKAFQAFICTEKQEQLICYGELIAYCCIQNQQICMHVAELLVQQKMDFNLCFIMLTNQGQTGLIYLFDIANRDLYNISNKILDFLCRTDTIITQLLIPSLIEDITSPNHSKYKDMALSILNRLGPVVTNYKVVDTLANLINDPTIDKKILLATIRSVGLEGQKILIQIVTSKNYHQNIVSLALSMLSWRIPSKIALRIKAIQFTIQNCFLPGRLYQYQGQVQPWNFQSSNCSDSLCLSSRDFIAQLQISIKEGIFKKLTKINNKDLFSLVQILALDQEQENIQISQQVVKTLSHELKNKSLKIKQIALIQLGNIGKPQASIAIQAVSKCLWDQDSTIRSAACWTISRICQEPNRKIQSKLSQLLKDHFWKVRTSACIALGLIVKNNPWNTTVQILLKTLQDGSIPKGTVCETLVRMGAQQLLLQILKGSNKNDFKLRQAIISSFEFSSLRSPLINIIVQELLRYSRDARIQTRQLCLLILNSLRKKVEEKGGESISYFQTKNLLPFYYCFLDDPFQKIRNIAAQSILSFGTQSELIFIQGMTKGQPLAKIQCIKSLGKLGVQNFRALILGLRDEDQRVKKAASNTILANFSLQQIIDEFKGRQNHSLSLICNLTEILKSGIKNEELTMLLRQIINGLEQSRKKGSIRHFNENIRCN